MTSVRREDFGPLVEVRCCRTWLVFILWGVGRCGLCKKVPS